MIENDIKILEERDEFIYKPLYYFIFNALTDIIRDLQGGEYERSEVIERLIQVRQETETRLFCNNRVVHIRLNLTVR